MRLLVLSDVHGRTELLRRAIEQEPEAREVFFLGDGLRDLEQVLPQFPDRRIHAVRGNCDSSLSQEKLLDAAFCGGKKILYLHGHTHGVKSGWEPVLRLARDQRADLLLFGHTHTPLCRYEDGLYVMNPGSLGYGQTYGIADLTDTGIFTDIREVRR